MPVCFEEVYRTVFRTHGMVVALFNSGLYRGYLGLFRKTKAGKTPKSKEELQKILRDKWGKITSDFLQKRQASIPKRVKEKGGKCNIECSIVLMTLLLFLIMVYSTYKLIITVIFKNLLLKICFQVLLCNFLFLFITITFFPFGVPYNLAR